MDATGLLSMDSVELGLAVEGVQEPDPCKSEAKQATKKAGSNYGVPYFRDLTRISEIVPTESSVSCKISSSYCKGTWQSKPWGS